MKNSQVITACHAALIAIALSFVWPAGADVLIFHPEIDDLRIQAEVQTQLSYKTYDQFVFAQPVSEDLETRLNQVYSTAQRAYLSAEWSDVELRWNQVIDFAYKADWPKKQREVIQNAWLRLAQMSTRPEEVQNYLRQAAQYDPDYEPSAQIFPPPLIQHYRTIRARLARIPVRSSIFKAWTKILRNGSLIEVTGEEFFVADGPQRLTFLSPKFLPVSVLVHGEEIQNLQLATTSILRGSCEKPILHESVMKRLTQVKWQARYLGGCLAQSDAEPTHKKLRLVDFSPESRITQEPSWISSNTTNEKPFYKKPNFWLGSALVIGAYLVYRSSQESEDSRSAPSAREGF